MKLTRTLTTLILLAMLTHAADLSGEYCIDTSEEEHKASEMKKLALQTGRVGLKEGMDITEGLAAAKSCYQFQAGNKVAYFEEVFGARKTFSGSYTRNGNSFSIVLDKGDEKQLLAYNKKVHTKVMYEALVYGQCSQFINDYEKNRWKYPNIKKYPQTQQGFETCVKESEKDQNFIVIKYQIDNEKLEDKEIEEALIKHSNNLSLVGNTLHKLNRNCKSEAAYAKKGSKASAFSFDESKQFCLNSAAYDKCGGKTYDPIGQQCENNVLFSKCGDALYDPAEKYCFKKAIKDKEFTDPRDGKKYKVVKIGKQTWMGENLNYHGKDGHAIGLCKDKLSENCEKNGRLYDWAEAMDVDRKYNDGGGSDWQKKFKKDIRSYQGICPEGWSLPLPEDWQTLVKSVGGEAAEKKLMKEDSYNPYTQGKCKGKTEDDRGNITEYDNCPTDEYGFSIDPDDKWWITAEHGPNYSDYFEPFGIKNDSKKTMLPVRCLQESEEAKEAAAAREKALKEKMDNSSISTDVPTESSSTPTKSSNTPTENSNLSAKSSDSSTKNSSSSTEKSPDLLTWLTTNVNWGLRLAYNGSTVLYAGENYGLGHGAEAGIIANIPIPNTAVEISIGANGIYRKPYTKEIIDQNSAYIKSELMEYVGSIPIMLKYNISDFYVQAGVQIDAPLKMEMKTINGAVETYEEEVLWRIDRDLGVALGLGWNINKNFALDAKMVGGISEFNKDIGGYKLVQGNAGLNYFF